MALNPRDLFPSDRLDPEEWSHGIWSRRPARFGALLLAMSGCVGSSSGTSGAEAPAEMTDERLFSASSPWNTPAMGSPDPTSALRISSDSIGSLKHAFSAAGKGFDIAGTTTYPDYGVPLYTADASTRRVQVGDTYGWWGGFSSVPLPDQATPSVGSDHHLAVWDVPHHSLYEFWEMRKSEAGEWMAGAGARFDTHGMGYQTEAGALGARAYGGSVWRIRRRSRGSRDVLCRSADKQGRVLDGVAHGDGREGFHRG